MGLVGLLFAILLIFLAGIIATAFYNDRLLMRLAYAYPIGIGFITIQLFFYSILAIPLGFSIVFLPWLLIGVFLIFTKVKWKTPTDFAVKNGMEKYTLFEKILLFIIFFQISFALINSVILPIKGFDTWVIWFLKGKAFYIDRGVRYDFFLNDLYSNGNLSYQYPLLVPLTVTLGYFGLGYIDDQSVKIFFSLYYVSLLIIFYHFLRDITSRKISLLLTAMLATVPRIMEQAAFGGVGYADIPLAVYFLGGAGFGYRYILQKNQKAFLLAIAFFSMAAWTKNEGITMLAAAVLFLSSYTLYRMDKMDGIKNIFKMLLILSVIVLPWQIYKHMLPQISMTMVSELSFENVLKNMARLPFILRVIVPKLFTVNKYHITWGLYMLVTICSLRKLKSTGYLYVQTLILCQFASYIFVYIITPFELEGHIDTSFDRLTIHLLPIAYLCIGILWTNLVEYLHGDIARI